MSHAPAPDLTIDDQRAALADWLARRHPGDEVREAETHVSILAFGRDCVWKLKKAVRYPFVDLATVELRRRQCEREVSLNRRLAPDVYLGVVPLDDDTGRVVDHLVAMRRMPDESRLAVLACAGAQAATTCLDQVADLVAAFHRVAATGGAIDASASRDAVGELWERNLAELTPHTAAVLDPAELEQVALLARAYLAGRAPLFAARVEAGRARDGHGDLLADDIFCRPDGPRVLDCLEFDDRLRFGDALADVAFLAMDLERLGRPDLARRFLDRYADAAGDAWPESLEHLYVAYRAVIRSKVACLRADDGSVQSADSAQRLLALARSHLESGRVRLVLVGGAPGTGKTTIASAVAGELGWPVLHSDEVRKELAGITASTHARTALDAGIYTPEWDARTYDALCDRARTLLELGSSVVLDASWSDPDRRAQAATVATASSSELRALQCTVRGSVAAARVAARAESGTDASDASGEIAGELAARFASWPEATAIDTTPAPETVRPAVIAMLRAGGAAAP